MFFGVLGGGVAGFLVLRAILGGVIGERTETGSTFDASESVRAGLAEQALARIGERPFFGDAFVPFSKILAGGEQAEFARPFPAHNQYLDIALRGGVLAAVVMVMLLVMFARRSWRLARRSPDPNVAAFHAGLLGIIAAAAAGT